MDKIYEAYTNIVEGKMKDIEQIGKKIAKHIGIKFKPSMISFSDELINSKDAFAKLKRMKKGELKITIASDPNNPKNGEIAIMHSLTPTHNGSGSIKDYTNNNLSPAVDEFISWSKARPSAAEVNGAMRSNRSRM